MRDIPLRVADLEKPPRFQTVEGCQEGVFPSFHMATFRGKSMVHTHATLLAQQTSTHVSGMVRRRKEHLQEETWTMIQWKRLSLEALQSTSHRDRTIKAALVVSGMATCSADRFALKKERRGFDKLTFSMPSTRTTCHG